MSLDESFFMRVWMLRVERNPHTPCVYDTRGCSCAEDVSAFYKSHCVFRQKKRHEQSLAPPSVASIAVRCT